MRWSAKHGKPVCIPLWFQRKGTLVMHSLLCLGSGMRLVLMTALVASLCFMPRALSVGTKAEVKGLLATVVIGALFLRRC